MVPAGSASVTICAPKARTRTLTSGYQALVSILIGCHPAIDNDDLQATSASSVVPVVRQLLKPA